MPNNPLDDYNSDLPKKERMLLKAEEYLKKHTVVYCHDTGEFYKYLDGYYKCVPEEYIELDLTRMFPRMNNHSRGKIIKNIRVLTHKSMDEFNAGDMLNFLNGIWLWDGKDDKFVPHDPKYLSTIRIPYEYDKDAKCPVWDKYLETCHPGIPENVAVLQEFAGYSLTKDTRYEKALFLIGMGANGKGTYTENLIRMLGKENTSACPLSDLANAQHRVSIINKLLNIDPEVRRRSMDFETAFQSIVSGDSIQMNPKYVGTFSYKPFCKLIFALNTMPRIDDQSNAFYRRLLVIEFNEDFRGERGDIDLKDNKIPQELSGIFNWSVEGLKRLTKQWKFTPNIWVDEKAEEYRSVNNPILQFTVEMLVEDPNARILKSEVYELYKKWCLENGNRSLSKKRFGLTFYENNRIITAKRLVIGNEHCWPGYRARTEVDDKFDSSTQGEKINVDWED